MFGKYYFGDLPKLNKLLVYDEGEKIIESFDITEFLDERIMVLRLINHIKKKIDFGTIKIVIEGQIVESYDIDSLRQFSRR